MMTAAKIQPLHTVKIFSKFFFKCLKGCHKIIRILFTQCMKMQSFNSLWENFRKLCFCDSKSRCITTWIINVMPFLCRALGIHTDADTDTICLTDVFIFFILCKGIKNNMVADRHQFLHVRFFISRCKNMILFSHFFISQSGFVQAAGSCAADVPPDHRIKAVHGKCFLCQQNMTACILF